MYLHVGQNRLIRSKSIIGIFDMDKTTVSKRTREYLYRAETEGKVENVSDDLPKSFIVCEEENNGVVYISPLSSLTLVKRSIRSLSGKGV